MKALLYISNEATKKDLIKHANVMGYVARVMGWETLHGRTALVAVQHYMNARVPPEMPQGARVKKLFLARIAYALKKMHSKLK